MSIENKQETVEKETVTITIFTDWECESSDKAKLARMRIEKSSQMASALFHLIEISCVPYEDLAMGEADTESAQRHLESIRSIAELGKQLAYQI